MNWKTAKDGLQPSFWRALPFGCLFALLFCRIRSDHIHGYIDGLRCLGVQSNITRGLYKMRKLGIGHVYDIMESVADAGERLETVIRVETAAGGLSPESAELLRSAYDAILSAVGDLAKAATW